MSTLSGEKAFSVLLFQGIAVIPMLAIMPFLAVSGIPLPVEVSHEAEAAHAGMAGWMRGLMAVGVVTGIVLAGRFLARPLFHFIAKTRSREVFLALALCTDMAGIR